ncbi:MAG: PHP domain-containing protein [Planctomycetota bacterium]
MRISVRRIVLLFVFFHAAFQARGDAIERLQIPKLAATHQAVVDLKEKRVAVPWKSGYGDYRAILHCHSKFSHDSRGTIERILEAAKAVGVQIIMFTEHPASHYDYFLDGHQGMKDGVLLIPGAESGGFLAYPRKSLKGIETSSPQEFADLVLRTGGLVFLSHLEERMDWEIAGLTGTEIYNTHADVKEERRLMFMVATPLYWGSLRPALEKYPQEFFAVLQDYPRDYLKRYDQLCQKGPLTGVAANDSHENIGIITRVLEGGKIRIEDAVGEKIAEIQAAGEPLKSMAANKKPGETIFEMRLDRYERSFGHVSTHLLLTKQTQPAVWDALQSGRAYVGFDWMADPTGFVYQVNDGSKTWPMGSQYLLDAKAKGVKLQAAAPLAAHFKLIQNGAIIHESNGTTFEYPLEQPGVYRVECWLPLPNEERPWILSNPIYVRAGTE